MFVTFHGIDGVGKTSTTAALANILNGHGYPATTFDSLEEQEPVVDLPATSSIDDSSLLKKMQQSALVAGACAGGMSVVRDRWLIDVYADRSHRGILLPSPPEQIMRPDLSFILTCDEQHRQDRIAQRENPTPDDLIPKTSGSRPERFENYLLSHVDEFAARSVVIDTTNISVTAVAKIAFRHVRAAMHSS